MEASIHLRRGLPRPAKGPAANARREGCDVPELESAGLGDTIRGSIVSHGWNFGRWYLSCVCVCVCVCVHVNVRACAIYSVREQARKQMIYISICFNIFQFSFKNDLYFNMLQHMLQHISIGDVTQEIRPEQQFIFFFYFVHGFVHETKTRAATGRREQAGRRGGEWGWRGEGKCNIAHKASFLAKESTLL